MLEVIRKHGLVVFMLALALVSLGKAVAGFSAGDYTATAGVAMLMVAIIAEEVQKREFDRPLPVLTVLRWAGFLGALGFLLAA